MKNELKILELKDFLNEDNIPLKNLSDIEKEIDDKKDEYDYIFTLSIDHDICTQKTLNTTVHNTREKYIVIVCVAGNEIKDIYYTKPLNQVSYYYIGNINIPNIFDKTCLNYFSKQYIESNEQVNLSSRYLYAKPEKYNIFKMTANKLTVTLLMTVKIFDVTPTDTLNIRYLAKLFPENKLLEKSRKLLEKDKNDVANDEIVSLKLRTGQNKMEISQICWRDKKARALYHNNNPGYDNIIQTKILEAISGKTHYSIDNNLYLRKNFLAKYYNEIIVRSNYNFNSISISLPALINEDGSIQFRDIIVEKSDIPLIKETLMNIILENNKEIGKDELELFFMLKFD